MALLSRTRGLTAGEAARIRDVVAHVTAGEGTERPRLDLDRLSAGEADELLGFVVDATENGVGIDTTKMSKRAWQLIAIASGWDASFYESRAAEAAVAARTAEQARQKRRLLLSRTETASLFAEWGRLLADPEDPFASDDVAVLALVLSLFCSGRTLSARSHFEGPADDVALHYDAGMGLVGPTDPDSMFTSSMLRIDALEQDGWFIQTRSGPNRVLRLGPRLLALIDLEEVPA